MASTRNARARAAVAEATPKQPDAGQTTGIIVAVLAFWPLLLVALICLLCIVAIVGGSIAQHTPVDSQPGGNGSGALDDVLKDDGKGTLDEKNVPLPDVVQALKDAGDECDVISPIVLAAQIQVESQFRREAVGPDDQRGIAQIPDDIFATYGKDDDGNGTASVLDPVDSIHAQARYLCALSDQVGELIDNGELTGDRLTLTLLAWNIGIESIKTLGTVPIGLLAYPYEVRSQFESFRSHETTPTPAPSPSPGGAGTGSPGGAGTGPPGGTETGTSPAKPPSGSGFDEAVFRKMFPRAIPFYSYAGLTQAMAKYPAFASGSGDVGKRELAAFLANVNHESGGLIYVEELNKSAWGNYCQSSAPYGCPAGVRAYHGRGPIQLSWNYNYYAAGNDLGYDLLHRPELVSTNSTVAWGTALWFWMRGGGSPHSAITGTGGFGATIRIINGYLECGGKRPDAVGSRVSAYRKFCELLGVDPGGNLTC
ncbi:transglycosylase SLT domain-containing protein [Micromonospora sp. ALFpr18c]|uniref:glycoside hydrolase family 19 protein n=1 Tax=Micromonospora sp. ALFpr18c TaxID=1458665 RepID=UPI00124B8302|nr:glycoside hydrolase family 19 protein [Micromonospora sp. ALFpr18c]KAB1939525.1 transglycosylase SLT domain-containing protein [Micromonospora sp. ALFpr18c]